MSLQRLLFFIIWEMRCIFGKYHGMVPCCRLHGFELRILLILDWLQSKARESCYLTWKKKRLHIPFLIISVRKWLQQGKIGFHFVSLVPLSEPLTFSLPLAMAITPGIFWQKVTNLWRIFWTNSVATTFSRKVNQAFMGYSGYVYFHLQTPDNGGYLSRKPKSTSLANVVLPNSAEITATSNGCTSPG